MATDRPRTVGELRQSGYRVESVKDEMRRNLVRKLQSGESLFPDILGYEETVVPQIQNAILSRHDMLFLGLRGQAKTRMLRQLVHLLDDAMPIIAGSEINDHPYHPVSSFARELVAAQGDSAPIAWVGRDQRYHEKLATPDVTIADLIGEIDMIKHAEGRYLSSETTMHYGLIPRTNRGIFCINELPDLAPKIQVGLFNVLEERDIQIRGYPVRLELDLCLVFSANPEDYTNRGRIVTPLKDRIGSVVRTHYPATREIGIAISDQNAWLDRASGDASKPSIPLYVKEVVEEVARLARSSPHVNQQSGVSVRMSIANLENVVSNAERRALCNKERYIVPRVADLAYAVASSRGKLELTMTEEEGHEDKVIQRIIDEAVKNIFGLHFDVREFRPIVDFFEAGQTIETTDMLPSKTLLERAGKAPGLRKRAEEVAAKFSPDLTDADARTAAAASAAEFILEGLHVHNKLNKSAKGGATAYRR
ncbi:MAG: sigma 54-interacting transcriptional regulator [Paludisphaera borealis]|uniref:sigma 54-interacting transcriptional regulator n=1 Tax=Paludisphaera borealis TaxID=1387353 RepID=UPI0028476571|nr:sigma 54-interacting transcriptional regulator [Paludisphaera borealis]MDR3619269.1 sigma 54-interacting transcriptional regulator [Paludisphaera borealis]